MATKKNKTTGTVIHLDLYRKKIDQKTQRAQDRQLRQAGFDYGLQAFRILCEEMHRGRTLDDRAVFYALARKSLSELMARGFTPQEIEQLIRDVAKL